MKTLTPEAAAAAAASVPRWTMADNALRRTLTFPGFPDAIAFVNAVAVAAESAGHHPDIDVRWNRVTLTLTTHDAGGLTSRDFALAAALDALRPDALRPDAAEAQVSQPAATI